MNYFTLISQLKYLYFLKYLYLCSNLKFRSVNGISRNLRLLTAEEEHDGDLAEDGLGTDVSVPDGGAGHHQEPDGVQVVEAAGRRAVQGGELQPWVTGVFLLES